MKTEYIIKILCIAISIATITACDEGKMEEKVSYEKLESVAASSWKELSEKKLYFGHQSVGNNIISGIRDLMNEYPQINLNIVETSDPAELKFGIFAHSKVGKNMDPISKINGFERYMKKSLGGNADIAFFKFCYIDIDARTDVKTLFETYRVNMHALKRKFSKTKFIHVTIPLKVVQRGPRAWVKRLIGRPIGGYGGNIKRNLFNDLVREEYDKKEPIFDLAMIESTYPDGKRMLFKHKGKLYSSLIPEYTHDGRHLDEKGRKVVAEQLLILLANI